MHIDVFETTDNRPTPGLTNLTIEAYRLLVIEGRPMNSRHVAEGLGITRQNVYRTIQPFIDRNMVRTFKAMRGRLYFRAIHKQYARMGYVNYAKQEFDTLFGEAYTASRRFQDCNIDNAEPNGA